MAMGANKIEITLVNVCWQLRVSDDGNSGDIFSLLYLSEGSVPFSQADLRELLRKANENNSKLGITGLLLFKGENFLQVLEGERETVLALYKKITQDPRHT